MTRCPKAQICKIKSSKILGTFVGFPSPWQYCLTFLSFYLAKNCIKLLHFYKVKAYRYLCFQVNTRYDTRRHVYAQKNLKIRYAVKYNLFSFHLLQHIEEIFRGNILRQKWKKFFAIKKCLYLIYVLFMYLLNLCANPSEPLLRNK